MKNKHINFFKSLDDLYFLKSRLLKKQVFNTLNKLEKSMTENSYSDGLLAYGKPLIHEELKSIKLQKNHKLALSTNSQTLGDWITTLDRGTIDRAIVFCRRYIQHWVVRDSQKALGGIEIEEILLNVETIQRRTKKTKSPAIFPTLFCKLCYRHSYQGGNYCEEHSPERNNNITMKNYRKNTRLFQRAIKNVIKSQPHTELMFGENLSTPDINPIWGVIQSWMGWKYPDSADSIILDNDSILRDEMNWHKWAFDFCQFINDLPRVSKKFPNIYPFDSESRSSWLTRLSKILGNYSIKHMLNEPQHLIASFARYDKYLFISELGNSPVGRPINKNLRNKIKNLKKQKLSYAQIGELLNISKSRAGKIGKDLCI